MGNNGVGKKQTWVSKVSEPIHLSAKVHLGSVFPGMIQRVFAMDGLKTSLHHPPHSSSKYICPVCSVTHFRCNEWKIEFND